MSTNPAGVRSASMGVVSGVGGAGCTVVLSKACSDRRVFVPHSEVAATIRTRSKGIVRAWANFMGNPSQGRADSTRQPTSEGAFGASALPSSIRRSGTNFVVFPTSGMPDFDGSETVEKRKSLRNRERGDAPATGMTLDNS